MIALAMNVIQAKGAPSRPPSPPAR
jgi:hypothetical protein